MGTLRDGGAYIDEGEFKNYEMDLIIPSQYTSQLEYMEKFMNIDTSSFLDSSRDFVVQGEMLKLFLVLQPPKSGAVKLAPKATKDDYNSQPNIGYHVDVRLRNPDDFVKTGTPHPASKQVSKTIMISNPKHGHVRHTPKLNNEYDTETASTYVDGDTATSSGSDATATTATTVTSASTVTSGTVTTPTATSSPGSTAIQDDIPKGPLSDFVAINSPASATKAKNSSKPNFFRLPDGTIVFPIEIPVGVKSKYNNKDISVVVSVARVMQPPPGGAGNGLASTVGGKLLGDALHTMFPGSPMAHQYVTSATKLEKLLSTQYPQYWQYSQYSRGGVGIVMPPTGATLDAKPIQNSHSNPNLVALGGSGPTLTRTPSSLSNPPTTPTAAHLHTSGLLSNTNSRSDPNISSLSEKEDTLSPLPPSNLLIPPTTPLTSRGSSGNLYGMGQLQTSTSSTTLSFASLVNTGGTSHATTAATNSNLGVSSGAPVSIKTAQKIVRVLEPLEVRLLQHYSDNSLKLGTKRLIPVAVSNNHPTLPITVRGLQLVLSNIPSLEGSNGLTPGPVPDISYNHVSVTDKYKTSTLDIETFPVTVLPGDEYQFVVTVEPHSPTSSASSSMDPTPPSAPARHSVTAAHYKRRVIHTLQAQLVITWSIPCSPGSILSIHPLPVSFPTPHDLLVSFDSKSPVRVQNVFNVCFTITNLSDYSRDLTFIIPRPVCVTGAQSSSISISTSTSSLSTPNRAPLSIPRSPPTRASTLPTIKFTAASMSTPSLPTVPLPTPTRVPSNQSVSSVVNSASTSSLPTFSPSLDITTPEVQAPRPPADNEMTVDEDELLTRFGELQSSSASMLCLEKTLYVGLVKSNSSVSVNVRYIPLREGLFEIQGLQIFDRATDQVYVVQDTCQLYVIA